MQVLANNNRECGVNETMKREIALLRRERIIFDRVFTRMKEELADCKDECKQLEEEIQQSYAERDASQYQMQELKTQYEQEKHAFMKEVSYTKKLLAH